MATHTTVNPNFEKWALDISWSGCDGGNLESPIWVCGVEWGFAKKPGETDGGHKKRIEDDYEQIPLGQYERPADQYDWEKNWDYPFGRSVAMLYMSLHREKVEDYKKLGERKPPLFKLNLYPIAFRNMEGSLWENHNLDKHAGFLSKKDYQVWCRENRFPKFADLVKQQDNLKLIVGVGIGNRDDFLNAFAGKENARGFSEEKILDEKKWPRFFWAKINDGKTMLAVIPFSTSRYGLNSLDLHQKVGTRLIEIANSEGIKWP